MWATRHRNRSSRSPSEGRAALAAARRAGRLGRRRLRKGRPKTSKATQGRAALVGIDATAPARYCWGDLAEQFKLRGYDAVHLASALALGAATPRWSLGQNRIGRRDRHRTLTLQSRRWLMAPGPLALKPVDHSRGVASPALPAGG